MLGGAAVHQPPPQPAAVTSSSSVSGNNSLTKLFHGSSDLDAWRENFLHASNNNNNSKASSVSSDGDPGSVSRQIRKERPCGKRDKWLAIAVFF